MKGIAHRDAKRISSLNKVAKEAAGWRQGHGHVLSAGQASLALSAPQVQRRAQNSKGPATMLLSESEQQPPHSRALCSCVGSPSPVASDET